ncbi:hypothetical protein AB0B40_01395 [Streptomyces sp. NPDC042638]|uniref:hypothetical protein n=1 Tax=Streptomyces sp. NPDC042638 TaxID=3154333 RepID=UPI0033F3A0C2
MQTAQGQRPLRTIVHRYGWPKVLLVACIIGASGGWISSQVNHNDGPPACAKRWAGVSGVSNADANKMVECDDQIDKWCAKNHPEDPDGCSNNITIDGDARNVGKD